jgi:hypothetical protein
VLGDHIGKSARCTAVRRDPQHLVGQPLHQLATSRVGHQAAEPTELAALTSRGVGKRLPQQGVGQRNRLIDRCRVIR